MEPVSVGHVSCATEWQRQCVKDACAELMDSKMPDDKRQYDGAVHVDMTYNPCDEYYTISCTMYNFRLRRTIPLLFTFVKYANAQAFAKHFETLFNYFDVLCPETFEFKLQGFMLDYSDAQILGLEVALGMYALKRKGNVMPQDSAEFLKLSRARGVEFSNKYCKGCDFHYAQSVDRVSRRVDGDVKEFKKLTNELKQVI